MCCCWLRLASSYAAAMSNVHSIVIAYWVRTDDNQKDLSVRTFKYFRWSFLAFVDDGKKEVSDRVLCKSLVNWLQIQDRGLVNDVAE